MALKKKAELFEIHQPVVEMVPLKLLEINPENPKKAMSKDRLKGLNRSLTEFGLRDMIKVAPHPEIEGAYLILDGNTRIEELRKRTGTDSNVKIPCLVHSDLTSPEKIREFVITFDRNVKAYDETLVLGQLKELVEAGENIDLLADLANLPDIQHYLDNLDGADMSTSSLALSMIIEQDSILISGPKSDIDGIKAQLKTIKGKLAQSDRASRLLKSVEGFNWDSDESFLFILLALTAHLSNATNRLVLPCVSFEEKTAIIKALTVVMDREGLSGDFALARAIEIISAENAKQDEVGATPASPIESRGPEKNAKNRKKIAG
jgi:hypothetical protein